MTDPHTPNDRRPTTGDVEEILASLAERDVDLQAAPDGSWEAIIGRLGLSSDLATTTDTDGRLAPVVEIPSLRTLHTDHARPDPHDGSDAHMAVGNLGDERSAEVASAVERARATTEDVRLDPPAPEGTVAAAATISAPRRRASAPRRWTRVGLAAAAAAVAVVGGLTLIDDRAEAPVSAASATLVHEAAFDPVGESSAAAVNVLRRDDDLVVEFTEADLPDDDLAGGEGLELWLLSDDSDGAVVGLVSLGVIDPTSPGDFTIPADVDIDEFSLVDISVEPNDGDPDHSGRSILRGRLEA